MSKKGAVPGAFGKVHRNKVPATPLAPKPAASTPAQPAIPKLPPPALTGHSGKSSVPAETRAGVREYDAFFALYAQSLNGKTEFWPLGFVPGPALLTYGDQAVHATPDVTASVGGHFPNTVVSLPPRVRQGMESWADLCDGLGYQPASWNAGQAKWLLSGRKPDGPLVMGMTRFRYRRGDPEVAFGVVLTTDQAGMAVSRVYNPRGIADVPAEGTVLSFAVLKDGKGPVQKLLRTWALMEANFSSRYNRDGSPRQDDSDRLD